MSIVHETVRSQYLMARALRQAGFKEHAINHAIAALFPEPDQDQDDDETGEWPVPAETDDALERLARDFDLPADDDPPYEPTPEDLAKMA